MYFLPEGILLLYLLWQVGKQNQQVLLNLLLTDEGGLKGQIPLWEPHKTPKENCYFTISSKTTCSPL